MIQIEFARPGLGPYVTRQETNTKALEILALVDLCWGGAIENFNKNSLTVRTYLPFGAVDLSTYSGTEDEMALLLAFCSYYMEVKEAGAPLWIKAAQRDLKAALPEKLAGNPLFVSALAPRFLHTRPVVAAIFSTFSAGETVARILCQAKVAAQDLIAIATLAHESGRRFDEVAMELLPELFEN